MDELDNYGGEFDRFVCYAPPLFRLLCELMDTGIDADDRREINSALAYFVLPNDFIPEDLYGPMGFADDIFVCVIVIDRLREKYGTEFLKEHWHNDEDFGEALRICEEKSRALLEERGVVKDVLEYAGLV